jgi:hypothetical protein
MTNTDENIRFKKYLNNISLTGVMRNCGFSNNVMTRIRYRMNSDSPEREKFLIGLGKSQLLNLSNEFAMLSNRARRVSEYFAALANEKNADHV